MGSVVVETKLTTVFGWWDWDAETPALVNRVTGERVAFRDRFEDPDLVPSDESWLRFDYQHRELNFPLLVEERVAEGPEDKGKTVWRVDYPRSNQLWKCEYGGNGLEAAFGAWRRVDDCITDAFAFWPEESSAQGSFAPELCLTGGWLNGRWCGSFVRFSRRSSTREKGPSEYDYDSWLIPLDERPPAPFVFHDHIPRRNGTEDWDVENPVLLDGLSFEHPEFRVGLRLPQGKPLAGLEGRTAYLLAADNARLLYPYYGDTEADKRGGHWSPSVFLLYADDIALADIALKPGTVNRQAYAADWHAVLTGNRFRVRQDLTGSPFLLKPHPDVPAETKMHLPSRPLWLRAHWGILDGWGQWPGSKARNRAWLYGLDLFRTRSLMVSSGYLGGKWSETARTTVTLPSSDLSRLGGMS